MSWAPLITLALALAVPIQEPEPGLVQGVVRGERDGGAIPYAVVEVIGSLSPIRAEADSLGRYRLTGVPAGRRLLRASGLGYHEFEVEAYIPSGRELQIDFELQLRPVILPEVIARGVPGSTIDEVGEGGRSRASPDLDRAVMRSLEASSGLTELGLTEITGTVRPGGEPADAGEILYVRGSSTDLKLVLLDGAPVYAPYQVGGLIPAFGANRLERAELFLGGAPSRYDGGLSYLLDLGTRPGDRIDWRWSGSTDLLGSEAMVEGPFGGWGGGILSGRMVHGLGAEWILGEALPYQYADALGRLDLNLGTSSAVRVTGYWNRESVRLGTEIPDLTRGAEWGNHAASLGYRGDHLGQGVEITAAIGRYGAQLPIGNRDQDPVLADGRVEQVRIMVDLDRARGPVGLRYGATYQRVGLEQRVWSPQVNRPHLEARTAGEVAGLYLDLDWRARPELRIRGGARADLYSIVAGLQLVPRLTVIWTPVEDLVLRVAGGQYRQQVRRDLRLIVGQDQEEVVQAPYDLRLARASHLLVGLDQRIVDDIRLGVEGYFKSFEEVHASGVDLWVRRSEGRLTGWLGYSLSWVWTDGPPGEATDLFSGRHLLSLGVGGEVGSGGELSLRVGYGAGLPFSAVPIERGYDPENSSGQSLSGSGVDEPPIASVANPGSSYLRIDAELSHPWYTSWAGSRVTIAPYLRVYNALNRRDASFYLADEGSTGPARPLAALPILPIIGVRLAF